MSISKKVFWIFLSVVLMIIALGVTVYVYQHGNRRMHMILHSLLDFNEQVFRLREVQLKISADRNSVTTFDLQGRVASIKRSSTRLYESLDGFSRMDINIKNLHEDIENYYKAINEFADKFTVDVRLNDEIALLLEKVHESAHSGRPEMVEDYEALEHHYKNFMQGNAPEEIKKINSILISMAAKVDTELFKDMTARLKTTMENAYINKLNMLERKSFLDLSSENFLRIASDISDEIKARDKSLDLILGYSASAISILSMIMAVVYWSVINKYIRKFLNNQAAVMNAIKSREIKKDIRPFSNDELGDLTQRMWKMAAELYEKDEELRESEEKYRTYINTTPLAVLVFDINRKIMEVNPGAVAMFGYSLVEFLDMRLDLLLTDDNGEPGREVLDLMTDRGRHGFLLKMFTKSRKQIYANVSSIKIEEDRFVAFCQDITQRILLEQELQKVNENLLEQVRIEVDKNLKQDQIIQQQKKLVDMGMMVSAIAHQWRQPLNALALCVQDIKEEFQDGEVTVAYLEMFESNTMKLIMHMSKTIDDFRDFFLPDKTLTDFNVIDELNDLVRLLNVQVSSRNIEMKLTCTCGRKKIKCDQIKGNINCVNDRALVRGFPGEFKQVVINLIYNSMDAIEEQMKLTPEMRGSIHIAVDSDLKRMEVCIQDNGTGVPEEAMPHMFEPYYTTKPEGKGTGIGLYMSKVIIESHMHGRLYLRDSSKGACMVIELPAVIE